MLWYEFLVPAVAANLLIRLDAVTLDPYWAFSDLVSRSRGIAADPWNPPEKMRRAVFRRYLYLVLVGVGLTLYDSDISTIDVAIVGAATAGLLLWPILYHGLPLGVARSDWMLVPLYTFGVLGGFVASALFGHYATNFAYEQSNGDIVRWALDEAIKSLIWLLIVSAFAAFYFGAMGTLRKRAQRRADADFERK